MWLLMRPSDEACFRVPVISSERVTTIFAHGGRNKPMKVAKYMVAPTAPIVSARDEQHAIAKLTAIYPGIVVGTPVLRHTPDTHRGEATNLRMATLDKVGFR